MIPRADARSSRSTWPGCCRTRWAPTRSPAAAWGGSFLPAWTTIWVSRLWPRPPFPATTAS